MSKQFDRVLEWLTRKKVLFPIFVLSIIIITLSLFWFANQNKRLENDYEKQFNLQKREQSFQDLYQYVQTAESAVRGYVISGNKRFVSEFNQIIDSITLKHKELRNIEKGFELQIDLNHIATFNSLLEQKVSFMQRAKSLTDEGNSKAAIELISTEEGLQISESIVAANDAKTITFRSSIERSSLAFINESNRNNNIAYLSILSALLLVILIIFLLISEVKRVRKLTKEITLQKEHFKTTLNSFGEGLISTNRAGKIVYMNPAAEMLTGWNWREAKNKPLEEVFKVINESTGATVEHIVSRILKKGKKIEWENNTILKARDNTSYIISNNGSPLLDEKGNIKGAVLVFNDISEKTRIETKLKENEKQLNNLIQNIPEAIYTCDAQGFIKMYNKAAINLWGREPVVGKEKWCGSWKIFDTQGREVKLDDCPMSITLKEKRPVYGRELIVERQDGTRRHILPSPTPLFNSTGDFIGAVNMLIDITDKKEREVMVKKTEEKYRNLFDQASDGVLIYSFDGTIFEFNSSVCKISGYTREEFSKLKIQDILVDDIIINPDNHALLIAGKTILVSRQFIRKDGSLRDLELSLKLIEGKHVMASGRDITEKRKAEKALSKSENYLRTIIEAEPECVKLLNIKGELEDMNPAGLAMIEASDLEQVKGKSILSLVGESYQNAFNQLTKNVFTGKSGTLEFEITGMKGTQRWLETHAVPMRDVDGNITSLLGVTRDITLRKKAELKIKESEERYRSLIEQASDSIIIYSIDGKILDYNNAFIAQMGYDKGDMNILTITDLLFAKDLEERPIHFGKIKKGIAVNDTRRIKCKDGKPKIVELNSKMMPDGNIMAIARDITERIKAEEKILLMNRQLRELSRHLQNIREEERTHIAREIHDELGQQLTVMKMDVAWLHEKLGKKDEKVKARTEQLNIILDETVKTVRRISSELRPTMLDEMGLGAAIECYLEEFEKRSGVKTKLETGKEELKLDKKIEIGLFRIMQESLTNVGRYAKAKKVLVSLLLKNEKVHLSITDDGDGYDEKEIANKKTLGILGMKERAAMMGGKYINESSPGNGTLVSVSVPINQKSPSMLP